MIGERIICYALGLSQEDAIAVIEANADDGFSNKRQRVAHIFVNICRQRPFLFWGSLLVVPLIPLEFIYWVVFK